MVATQPVALANSYRVAMSLTSDAIAVITSPSQIDSRAAQLQAKLAALGIEDRSSPSASPWVRTPASRESRSCPQPRAPRRATYGWASLTASEQTIVGLVGEGLTNPRSGQRLYISRRTVESHLGRVHTKLGLTTRGQLVAAAVRRAESGAG